MNKKELTIKNLSLNKNKCHWCDGLKKRRKTKRESQHICQR